MKYFRVIYILVLFVVLSNACGYTGYTTIEHYITYYATTITNASVDACYVGGNKERLVLGINLQLNPKGLVYDTDKDLDKKKKYLDLVRKYNDYWGHRDISKGDLDLESKFRICLDPAIVKIKVVSAKDNANGWERGKDLSDLFTLVTVSPYDFIKNGYVVNRKEINAKLDNIDNKIHATSVRNWIERAEGRLTPIYANVGTADLSQYKLLDIFTGNMFFFLKSWPDDGTVIRIQFHFSNGNILDIPYEFGQKDRKVDMSL